MQIREKSSKTDPYTTANKNFDVNRDNSNILKEYYMLRTTNLMIVVHPEFRVPASC